MIYFTAHTFKCVCHCRRAMFRVLGMYNFDPGYKNMNFNLPCFSIKFSNSAFVRDFICETWGIPIWLNWNWFDFFRHPSKLMIRFIEFTVPYWYKYKNTSTVFLNSAQWCVFNNSSLFGIKICQKSTQSSKL